MTKDRSPCPPCPDCGGPSRRNGKREGSNSERYQCKGVVPDTLCATKPRRFTDKTKNTPRKGSGKLPKRPPVEVREELKDTHVFIITYGQNATPVHEGFWAALNACVEHRNADLLVKQGRYRNPTTRKEGRGQLQDSEPVGRAIDPDAGKYDPNDDEWWDERLLPYLWNKRKDLIPGKLTFLGKTNITPTAARPLSGMDSITGGASGIIAHPHLELRTIATPHQALPKTMATTGACTVKNYSESKTGEKGEFHHTIGARIVEIRGNDFFTREINACEDGSFIDLIWEYRPDGTVRPAPPAEALSMGDWHSGFTCDKVIGATFTNEDNMFRVLRPKRLFWGDLLDQYGRNHHHRDDPFIAIAKERDTEFNRGDLMQEVRFACEEVNKYTEIASRQAGHRVESIIKCSNHDEALTRWVKEGDWKKDPENAEFYLETALRMARETSMSKGGHNYPQALHVWARELCPQAVLLDRSGPGASYMVMEIECGMHGDVGPNGARGSAMNISKIGVKTIIEHSHTPHIVDGCYQSGTSTVLDLRYNRGPSSWMNTHTVVYGNGKRALLTVIEGQWHHADDVLFAEVA